MNTTQQPEALRLADKYEAHGFLGNHRFAQEHWCRQAATELRSQHARILELEAVLSAMGEKGNPVKPADIPRATDKDTHFFLAGWNGRAAQVDPHEHFRNAAATAPAYPAEGATAQIETLRAELAEETEAAENWRRLALQFDHHRLQALGHIKAVVNPGTVFDAYKAAKAFLKAPPLDGEEVLAQRIAELAATPAATRRAPAAPVPSGWKLVPVELLERIQESLGSFVSDQGWSESDMDTADALDGLLAAAPQSPEAAQLNEINVADMYQVFDLKGEE